LYSDLTKSISAFSDKKSPTPVFMPSPTNSAKPKTKSEPNILTTKYLSLIASSGSHNSLSIFASPTDNTAINTD